MQVILLAKPVVEPTNQKAGRPSDRSPWFRSAPRPGSFPRLEYPGVFRRSVREPEVGCPCCSHDSVVVPPSLTRRAHQDIWGWCEWQLESRSEEHTSELQ